MLSESPEYTVTARELYNAYDDNEAAAYQRYKDRVLEITGEIDNIGKTMLDSIYVTLETGKSLGRVQIIFSDEYEDVVAGLKKGQRITVRGVCKGMSVGYERIH